MCKSQHKNKNKMKTQVTYHSKKSLKLIVMTSSENDRKQLPDKEFKKNTVITMVKQLTEEKDKEIKEVKKLIQDVKTKWNF